MSNIIRKEDNIHLGIEKLSGVLPEFLAKARREGFIDPRTDDFSKNQAFGRAMGAAMLGQVPGLIVGGQLGARRMAGKGAGRMMAAALAGSLLGGAVTGSIPAALVYRSKLKKFRKAQEKGLNPITLRKHDPKKIERTRKWATARFKNRKGKK